MEGKADPVKPGRRYDSSRRRRQALRTREVILEAARQLFLTSGYVGTTIVAIAERQPSTPPQLLAIAGIGARKLGQYGAAVFALVAGASPDDLGPENFAN